MLVRTSALHRIGGIAKIRTALIDDCALGREMKKQGSIWLGLTQRMRSRRPYHTFGDLRRMIVRSASAHLNHSPARLCLCLVGLCLTVLAAPALVLVSSGLPRLLAIVAYLLMAISFLPTLRLYRRTLVWSLALPLIAAVYGFFTLESALRHATGSGGMWKGRAQAAAGNS